MEQEWSVENEKFVEFKCPYCGKTISFQEEFKAHAQACPECRETIVVPAEGVEFGKKIPLPIETERLILRQLRMDDSTDLMDGYSRENEAVDEVAAQRWLKSIEHGSLTLGDCILYLGITLKSTEKVIGYFSIESRDVLHAKGWIREITLKPACQTQGYETEVLRGVLDFCFSGIGMHRVASSSWSDDAEHRRSLEEVGMRLEGEFIEDEMREGEWANSCYYAILEREYRASKEPPPKK